MSGRPGANTSRGGTEGWAGGGGVAAAEKHSYTCSHKALASCSLVSPRTADESSGCSSTSIKFSPSERNMSRTRSSSTWKSNATSRSTVRPSFVGTTHTAHSTNTRGRQSDGASGRSASPAQTWIKRACRCRRTVVLLLEELRLGREHPNRRKGIHEVRARTEHPGHAAQRRNHADGRRGHGTQGREAEQDRERARAGYRSVRVLRGHAGRFSSAAPSTLSRLFTVDSAQQTRSNVQLKQQIVISDFQKI